MVKGVARLEGVLVGISSGAALVACLTLAEQLAKQGTDSAVIVTVLPDSADKYLSEKFWNE
jgi:S-sulfo-L-cysteine synthase (O-acetyl-L-serine-dependent)